MICEMMELVGNSKVKAKAVKQDRIRPDQHNNNISVAASLLRLNETTTFSRSSVSKSTGRAKGRGTSPVRYISDLR